MRSLIILVLSFCFIGCDKKTESVSTMPSEAGETVETDTVSGSEAKSTKSDRKQNAKLVNIKEFTTIEWIQLMPQEDIDALMNPPAYVTEVEDGSEEDQISSQISNTIAAAADDEYQQALVSRKVVEEFDGKAVRIAGFIVPVEFDGAQTITQFFLVPYFGACIHYPPPPPNQLIFVDYPKGIQLEVLYEPFWISGLLETEIVENDVATSAYHMQMVKFEKYEEMPQ